MAASRQSGDIAHWGNDWVSARFVMKRFGFCERTLRTYVAHGMPKHLIGKRQMRFVLREVHDWLVRAGAVRFAAIGRTRSLREARRLRKGGAASKSVSVSAPAGLKITDSLAPSSRQR